MTEVGKPIGVTGAAGEGDSADVGPPVVPWAGRAPPTGAHVLRRIARSLARGDRVGLTLLRVSGTPETLAATDDLSRAVDALQLAVGQGPCLDAARGLEVVLVDDVRASPRWPVFSERCVTDLGVHSVIALRLLVGGQDRAALGVYSRLRERFSVQDMSVVSDFAPIASMAVQAQIDRDEGEMLRGVLASSREVGVAVGILMARRGLTLSQAVRQLQEESRRLRRSLVDVARAVGSGDLQGPTGGGRPRPPL